MPVPPVYLNSDPKLFGYSTARSRWPKILQGALEDVSKLVPEASRAEFTRGLQDILDAINNDDEVKPFTKDEIAQNSQLTSYNESLAQLLPMTWQTGPWLYLECHLYQMIEAINLRLAANVDIFEALKHSTFKLLQAGVHELAKHVNSLEETKGMDDESLRLLFREFIDISLWGNATDLSLLAGGISVDDINLIQGKELRRKNEEKIIVNEIDEAWKWVRSKETSRYDIVLDNSGFELYADLCLSVFLLKHGLAKEIHLHSKEIPWFVSDTMPKDVDQLLAQLVEPGFFDAQDDEFKKLHATLKDYFGSGAIRVDHHPFWTLEHNFWKLGEVPGLSDTLRKSDLIIFKGDLNYRKLTGDCEWPETTPFTEAIQDLARSQLPVLTLRTCKADVVVGLPEGKNEELCKEYEAMTNGDQPGYFWTALGKWAVIQFSDGSK